MIDPTASSLPRPSPNSDPPTRPHGRSSLPRASSSYGSYVTGESSFAASQPHDALMHDTTPGRSSPYAPRAETPDNRSPRPPLREHRERRESKPAHDDRRKSQPHKPRPSSGFLLSNKFKETPRPERDGKNDDRRRSRIPVDSRKGKSPMRSSEDSETLVSTGLSTSQDGRESVDVESNEMHPSRVVASGSDLQGNRPHTQMANRRRSMLPSPRPSSALDVDSTQIVSMALDLSESRRLAQRRNISTPIPPRLAQLPDTTPALGLKQHLQQQRRTSRNLSPRADSSLSQRVVSTPRITSPLQPTFDQEGSYTYHFSSSTLNRAQKAKEYMELMAQYRRLLLFLPPLKQAALSRPSTSSPVTTPSSAKTSLDLVPGSQSRTLGRAYNPLQYIRNRKIRTSVRQTIDGEAQGFGEVPRVTDWIDQVATFTAASLVSGSPKLPVYPAANEYAKQNLPASNIPRPVSASNNKPKRPRLEWSIEPADMLADIYWLDQDGNKFLIEDRNYAKIFTPMPELPQPMDQVSEHNKSAITTPAPQESLSRNSYEMPERDSLQSPKPDSETALATTRGRARQKLSDLRGLHHKHSNSIYSHHDFLRFRRGSSSDSSANDSDRRRRGRTGTISASGQDLLEKQMSDMLARESQDQQGNAAGGVGANYLKPLPAAINAPEPPPQPVRATQSRQKSRIETPDEKIVPSQTPPVTSGRASLEVPSYPYRPSLETESPRPPLSDIPSKGQQNGYIPAIGSDLSPITSRGNSPARNPFSKVKSIFRERSRERSREREDRESDASIMSPIDVARPVCLSPVTEDAMHSHRRSTSQASARELVTRTTGESHKSHRSMGSFNLRSDDQVGLRTIFKGGAKLDDMIRGSVLKVSDLIWKKDSDSESTDDESDRGRSTESTLLSPVGSGRQYDNNRRPVKNYMDIMPSFKSASESMGTSVSHNLSADNPTQVLSRPPSRSPRFDSLKPPRIDVRGASPESSELDGRTPQNLIDSDLSEIDSRSRDPDHPTNYAKQPSKELSNALVISGEDSSASRARDKTLVPGGFQNWVIPDRTSLSQHAPISRREVARLRTLILCSGIKAMELSRRANEPHPLVVREDKDSKTTIPGLLSPSELRRLAPNDANLAADDLRVPQSELFPTTARILTTSISTSLQSFEESAAQFSSETAPALQSRVDDLHNTVAIDLMDMTRRAADEADDVSHDIVDCQRMKVKSVLDAMDKMLRRRRRRFRWVRRAGWLAVEWVLVGIMWYVWAVVVLCRVVMGVGRGVGNGVRWLFWL
ncbi:hypothetical protein F4808DRAFT_263492 [Astrocystis sublimbata]|nr:hypothetical protein F4808DRAFT_263492 [Astrocystis sublimbata]